MTSPTRIQRTALVTLALSCASALPHTMLIGGGESGAAQAEMLDLVVALGGGPGVGVVTAAAAAPGGAGCAQFAALFLAHGANTTYCVPIFDTPDGRANNSNAAVVSELASLSAIFIAGGDQMRVVNSFFNDEPGAPHTPSPALNAILQNALIVAGTSAGAESQTSRVVIGDGTSYFSLLNGASAWQPGDPDDDTPSNLTEFAAGGLGSFPFALVDAHFAQRGRQGRQLRLLLDTRAFATGSTVAVGIDEDTALLTSPEGRGIVLGNGGVLIWDVDTAAVGPAQPYFSCANVTLSLLTAGDAVDFATLRVTPVDFKAPIEGREARDAPLTSLDVFAEQQFAFGGVATSLFDSRGAAQSTWAATKETGPRFNLTMSKAPSDARGFVGVDAAGRRVVSFVRMRLAVDAV